MEERPTDLAPPGDQRAAEARARRVEQLTHIGSWEWNLASKSLWWSDELYRIYGLVPGTEMTFERFLERVHPEDRPHTTQHVSDALAKPGRFAWSERIVRPDGAVRTLQTVGEVVMNENGVPLCLVGTCRDVTEKLWEESLAAAQQRVLEAVASDAKLSDLLHQIAAMIEAHSPGTLASILLVDPDGKTVRHGAAPSLPKEFITAVDGEAIGPFAGSCGTAAYTRKPVYVEDIETDPLWANWREAARAHGLRACWSTPFFAKDGHVLGTFAVYYRSPKRPTPDDLKLIQLATHLTGIAVESRQMQEQLRALSEHVESVREEERTAIAREIHDVVGQALTGLKMDLSRVDRLAEQGKLEPGDLGEQVRAMVAETDELLGQVRRISSELRPGVLDDLGLVAAVEWQANEFTRRTGTECKVVERLGTLPLGRPVSTAAFRIFQEALMNVSRHAGARRVTVTLEESHGELVLTMVDDGKGIAPEAVTHPRSLGLLGMRERAARLGGTVVIGPGARGGTQLELRLPLMPKAERS